MTDMTNRHKMAVALLQNTVGEKCWHVSKASVTLPTFSLTFGRKVPRAKPLRNSDGTSFSKYTGRISLYVWCTWRLENGSRVLVSSDDDKSEIARVLQRMVGDTVAGFELMPPAWDLRLRFANGKRLHIFCDHTQVSPSYDGNWSVRVGSRRIDVGPGAKIAIRAC